MTNKYKSPASYPVYNMSDVRETDVLDSASIWEKICAEIPNVPIEMKEDWWLRESNGIHVKIVSVYGDVRTVVKKNFAGVRPVVHFKIGVTLPDPGCKILLGKYVFTIYSEDSALSDEIITTSVFDMSNRSYENSKLYKTVRRLNFEASQIIS